MENKSKGFDAGNLVAGLCNCSLLLEAAQVRIHSSSRSNVYCKVQSQPVIETCTELQFAPLDDAGSKSDAEEQHLWSQVQDFSWLRAGASPNWSVLFKLWFVGGMNAMYSCC